MRLLKGVLIIAAFVCFVKPITNATEPEVNTKKTIKVDESSVRDLKVSEFATSVQYIPLETNNECLLTTPSAYIVHDNKIYIYDPQGDVGIYCFSMDGKFINKRTTIGRGQGEFTLVMNIEVNAEKKEIYLFDVVLQKIVVLYDDLRFKREIFFRGHKVKDIKVTSDNQLYGIIEKYKNSKLMGCIAKFSDKGERIYSKETYQADPHGMSILCSVGSKLLVAEQLENNIYKLENDKLMTHYEIDFGHNNLLHYNTKRVKIDQHGQSTSVGNGPGYVRGRIMLECANQNYTVVRVSDKNNTEKILISNTNSDVVLYKDIVNDINGLCLDVKLCDSGNSSTFCQSIPAIELIDYYEGKKGAIDFSDSTRMLIKNLKPEDNNVLVLIETK